MNESDGVALRAAISLERRRVTDQIANLQRSLDGIVGAAELTSTDDEHDPEGATIAYERAQVTALLRQAQDDLAALDGADQRIDQDSAGTCKICGEGIAFERLLALPGARTCVRCAS